MVRWIGNFHSSSLPKSVHGRISLDIAADREVLGAEMKYEGIYREAQTVHIDLQHLGQVYVGDLAPGKVTVFLRVQGLGRIDGTYETSNPYDQGEFTIYENLPAAGL